MRTSDNRVCSGGMYGGDLVGSIYKLLAKGASKKDEVGVGCSGV